MPIRNKFIVNNIDLSGVNVNITIIFQLFFFALKTLSDNTFRGRTPSCDNPVHSQYSFLLKSIGKEMLCAIHISTFSYPSNRGYRSQKFFYVLIYVFEHVFLCIKFFSLIYFRFRGFWPLNNFFRSLLNCFVPHSEVSCS